ncbi:MAG: FtsX-like permease family protein, partial [Bacillota bacterium]|nr:FtsX-like permease family protein [Bacillota bacterium]
MDILNRKLLRDLRQFKGQFLSVLVIVIIGVMFFTGINSAFYNLNNASEKYYAKYRLADIWASFDRAPESVENKIASLGFVEKADARIVKDVKLDIDGESAVIRLITLPDEKKDMVNDVMLTDGTYFTGAESNQCLVEEGFYRAHGLKPGDFIYPVADGREIKLRVAGSSKSPEYVYPIREGEIVPDNKKFGVVYIKQSFGQATLGYSGSANSLSITVKDGTDMNEAKEDVKKFLKEYGVREVIDRDGQVSAKMLSEEMKGLKSSGGTFPVVFFIMAAVIIYITMGRIVENQRTQIGVLKAFGFTNMQVLAHYLSYSVFIAVTGSAVGAVFGMFLGKGVTDLENQYFNLPAAQMKMYPELVVPATLLTLAFCLTAGFNACKNSFRIMPSEAMRPRPPLSGHKTLLENIGPLWNRLSYSSKMIFRNMLRNKRRALLTSTGVIFATALTFISFGEMDSINFLIKQQYGNIQSYDIKVGFSNLLNMQEVASLRSIAHVKRVEPVFESGVEIRNGWRKKDVMFTAISDDMKIYRVTDSDGNTVKPPDDGILVPDRLAKELGIKTGDTVTVRSYLPGKEKKEMQVKGIIAQYIGSSVYGSMDCLNKLAGEGYIASSAVIKLDSGQSEAEVLSELKKMPEVISSQSKTSSLDNLNKSMGSMTSFIGIMILLAAVLAIAVIYNIATINIFERQRELATLKVLGFKDNEVKSLIYNENYMITLFGIVVGLPFGRWLGQLMFSMSQTDTYNFTFIA